MKTEKMCVFEISYLKGKNIGQLKANVNEHDKKKNNKKKHYFGLIKYSRVRHC